jgi:GNAT superfamily N-acetyltransferase
MEPYRGMGIARVLVARLVEIGPPEIYVWTKDRNLAMVYAKYADYLGNREYFENVIYVYVIRNPEVISL